MKLDEYYPYIDMLVNDFKKKHTIDFSVNISWKIARDKERKPRKFVVTMELANFSVTTWADIRNILTTDFQFYTVPIIQKELVNCYSIFEEHLAIKYFRFVGKDLVDNILKH